MSQHHNAKVVRFISIIAGAVSILLIASIAESMRISIRCGQCAYAMDFGSKVAVRLSSIACKWTLQMEDAKNVDKITLYPLLV